jgi:type II secretory pathway component GspD/PulD (secretin)
VERAESARPAPQICMTTVERSGLRPGGRLVLCVALASVAGCLAPRESPAREGSVEEVGRMLARGDAKPVRAHTEEGLTAELGDEDLAPPSSEAVELSQVAPDDEPEISPYIRFGERIIVRERDGVTTITKPYPMPPGKAAKIVELLDALQPFPYRPRPGHDGAEGAIPPPEPGSIDYLILENWDQEYYGDLRALLPTTPTPVNVSDVLVISATADMIARFEAFIDLFAAGVPQIELEARIIEIVETDSLDVGVRSTFAFGSANFVKALDLDFGNVAEATEALLTIGAIQDGTAFNALIEAVSTWQNVSIESRPKTVVRAGGVARLDSITRVPYFEIKSLSDTGSFTTNLAYNEVGVKLYIAPRVIGSKTLALDVNLEGSQVVGSQGTLSVNSGDAGEGATLEVPVISARTAKTVVYLEPGQTLVIGGLTQDRDRKVVSKVPILGDIPILGFLFRNTSTRHEKEHVLFAISPRIVQRSELTPDF